MNEPKIKRYDYVEFDHELGPDELMHFKYISKKKINGKWRYYYDKLADGASDAIDALKEGASNISDTVSTAKNQFQWGYERGNTRNPSGGGVLNKTNANPTTYRQAAMNSDYAAKREFKEHMNRPRSMDNDTTHLKRYEAERANVRSNLWDAKAAKSVAGKAGQVAGRAVRRGQQQIERASKMASKTIKNVQKQAKKGKKWFDKLFH